MNTLFSRLEALFILIFGAAHFAIPFLLPPNLESTTLWIFPIGYFVLPGCFAVAISGILYFATKRLAAGACLAFLYGGGIFFHALYLLGLFPSVLTIPSAVIPIGGIIIDALSIAAIYNFYRRVHSQTIRF
ncbi:MAG: hypothetical protein ACQCN4_03055 [Candidatus Bathyarchaeia archaeon]|jgi:hypothetical protein